MKLSILISMLLFAMVANAKTLVFGVVPQQSPSKMLKAWGPVIAYLEKTTGEKIQLKTERSIQEFEQVLYAGGYDFAYANPYDYTIAQKKQGYSARLRDIQNLAGIIVVPKNSPITDVSMLRGKRFLFPTPDAFAATLLVKYELAASYGIDLEKERGFLYVNSHDSVYKGVARGIGDAGGGIERTLNALEDVQTKKALRVVYKTKGYPSHPIAFKPTLSSDTAKKISEAFLTMPENLLARLKMKQLVRTEDAEYDSVRKLSEYLPAIHK